ncbi:MAG: hypothetical protein RR651_05410 [Lysinibacillus sp.]
MNKYKKEYHDTPFKLYLAIAIILAIYFSIYLSEAISMQKNMYDFMIYTTDILTVSYVIVPLFLIILVSSLSTNSLNNLFLLRYQKKSSYYNTTLKSIFFVVTKFLFLLIGTIAALSLFFLSFQNEWSVFAKKYFKNYPLFLDYYSPLLYLINSLILLWLFLLFLGFLYFILLLLTKNTAFSLIGTIVVIVANIAVTISHLELVSRFFFTKHLDLVQYMYVHKMAYLLFPFELYLYWIILLLILYILGYKLIHKLDLDLKKGA